MPLSTHHHRESYILYDRARLSHPEQPILPPFGEAWLDPQAWVQRGLVTGTAPGRGASQFLSVDGNDWVLRPYRRGGMAAKISRMDYLWRGLENTRAFEEMRLTHYLFKQNLPVPAPVAALVVKHRMTYHAALMTERLPDSQALAERLTDMTPELLADVGATIRRFHDAGLDHVDLNARNLLVDANDRIWLIDFDRCRLRTPGRWQEANLARLKRSLFRFSPATAEHAFAAIMNGYRHIPSGS
ncbi:3-deoxy-D-manno-octulosonic acid kinase [Chromohalobacter nigrandesensis]|uniref:3-deoxy-D-manno-octulosonic acid kinase n=1 Tax=Chromohalobacter nigrandesensis TaxID=119863 RepID=UPI001FF38B4F|nr:3-deoxy-D-manno-octulosonic acid kinase [Chromohalobacter nigrandesensis]MCK0744799.1 3-deoxy-D-manno-octulosonic acid kinase [Chromohalobacter nigrandesensis]